MNILKRPIIIAILALLIGASILFILNSTHTQHDSKAHDHKRDADGNIIHDEVNMPGLIGADTTDIEIAELRALFINHTEITRTVENLPNGIKTITETENPELRDQLISHVIGMMSRVSENRDPQIPIQSPMLTPIFEDGASIITDFEITEKGIIFIQTSDNPDTVDALQKHAAEVSDLAARGMEAVHERMDNSN